MIADQIVAVAPLTVALLGMAAFGTWTFIHARRSNYKLRWALVPVSLVAALFSAQIYDARLGYAVPEGLPAKFVYLAHHVMVRGGHKVGIEVWAQTNRTRLYEIPYSKSMEDALEQGKAAGKKGGMVVMRKPGKPSDKKGEGEEQDPYESNLALPSDIDPKTE